MGCDRHPMAQDNIHSSGIAGDYNSFCSVCGVWTGAPVDYLPTDITTSSSGVNRSSEHGKLRYDLLSMLMLRRWASHMTKNVADKGEANWRLACTEEDIARAKRSVWRHFMDWYEDVDTGEDNAAAMMFGIGLVEEAKEKLHGSDR